MTWRGGLAVAVVSMAAASLVVCGGDDGSSGSGGADDEGASPEFCDKAEAFNDATTSVRGIASADEMQEAVDQLDEVAEQAPTAISEEFTVLTGVLERLVTAMRTTEDGDDAATVAAMQKVLTPETTAEVEDASRTVEAYLEIECGFDPDGEQAVAPTSPPTSTAPAEPARLGNNVELNRLARACFTGNMVKCDELYFASPPDSTYEAYGDSCGRRTEQDDFCVDIYPPPED